MTKQRWLSALLCIVLPSTAWAQSYWSVRQVGEPQGGIVTVEARPSWYVDSDCIHVAPFCPGFNVQTLDVTPCPIGQTCQNDRLHLSFPVGGMVATLQLQVGTTYTFSGFWMIEKLFPDCSYPLCSYGDDFDPRTFPESTVSVTELPWENIKLFYR